MSAEEHDPWVGLDLGGTAIKAGRIGAGACIAAEVVLPLESSEDKGEILDRLAAAARELVRDEEWTSAARVGVGVPGFFDRARGLLRHSPNIPGLRDCLVPAELAPRLGLAAEHVRVENDANCAGLGELWLGAASGLRDFVFVTLGTGVGGAVVLDRRLHAGHGMAGEIGHVVVDPAGEVCGCGSRGCLETLASARAAQKRAVAAGLPEDDPGNLVLLCERARAGGEREAHLLREVGRGLGYGLAAAVCLLDVRAFVFGGGFSAALDLLEPGIREGLEERSIGDAQATQLLQARLGPKAGWIGAASLWRASTRE